MDKIKTISLLSAILFLVACRKYTPPNSNISSVSIVNVGVNLGSVKVNYFGRNIAWSSFNSQVSANGSGIFSVPSGSVPIEIVSTLDTLTTIYSGEVSMNSNDIYTLYLYGVNPAIESLLIKETSFPTLSSDSIVKVRFINLAQNAPKVSVTLSSTPDVAEFTDISYGNNTNFNSYEATKSKGSNYVFQVRDENNNILASSTLQLNTYRFKYVTLVFRGIVGGTPSAGVTIVRNF